MAAPRDVAWPFDTEMIARSETEGENSLAATWQQLRQVKTVQRFQAAFTVATGLPVTILPAGLGGGPGGAEPRGAFCIDGCMGRESGRWCLRTLVSAEQRATKAFRPVQFRCPAGLIKILVPVRVGGRHAGNFLVGPFSLETLQAGNLRRLVRGLKEFGLETQAGRLQVSWRYSPVISAEKVEAVVTLVNLFAQYLSETGHRLVLEDATQQSPLLQKIEAYLAEGENDEITLTRVAERVCLSPCHFCRLFKKQTGLTFTEYRVRRRVEIAKELLLNRQLRISEAAFAAGFGSLPHFNLAFRRYAGCSPSEYRAQNSRTKEDKRMQIQA